MDPRTALRPTVSDPADHAADLEAIRAVVADVEAGFNANDVDRSVAHFTGNALVVNALGAVVSGWDAIRAAHEAGYAGFLRDQHARYEVADVTFLRPDVAVALKQARATDAAGEPIDVDHAMRALYVLVREGDRWWIAARGNTLVVR